MANHALELTGRKFGRLTVVRRTGIDHRGHVKWKCLCDCGAVLEVVGVRLAGANTQSCGCYRRDRLITHGLSKTPFRDTWRNLLKRCYDSKDPDYKHYGGRGIKACESIRATPSTLLRILGERPYKMTVDRINNNAGYTCGECSECLSNNWGMNLRWATRSQQALNQRRSRNNLKP